MMPGSPNKPLRGASYWRDWVRAAKIPYVRPLSTAKQRGHFAGRIPESCHNSGIKEGMVSGLLAD